ncbi:hypothetical protein MSHOH_2918 [Methanosarcina horonobensis HB-1 = JCM 15518]|uniref:DUF2117 domain-containing protein n=1 Tax=Methanosarcina horonobensis HB-1 = JCM 15518 TaxID=1434110 RepID=A0A0E3SEM1_9EURY|nr:DUF2117 family protein [Methanosarcina horonobensis]AKB79401.1 hypothetical protein MSHOH_2918 [Methanosarcina horonobensis HB-1 = JCM 15518]
MQIGIVIHNLQLMDSPQTVKNILTLLSRENCINACLCGTMGKVAAIDAGLENLIEIEQVLKPSACIEALFRSNDLVCLLNHGRELQTGRIFGRIVVSHIQNPEQKPLIQIERPGCVDGELIAWNRAAELHIEKFSGLLNLKISQPPLPVTSIEISDQGRRVLRRISTFPGANIMVEGFVVGKATSSEVALISQDGFLISMEGGVIKEQGIKILHNYEERVPVDMSRAWVKTAASRKNPEVCENLPVNKNGGVTKSTSLKKSFLQEKVSESGTKVILIDHCAERSLEILEGAGLAITIGDDTTEIAGSILSRFGIPVIGITDGDCDELATAVNYASGSMVLLLKPGKDDELGIKLKEEIFSGRYTSFFENIEDLKLRIINFAEDSLKSISEY